MTFDPPRLVHRRRDLDHPPESPLWADNRRYIVDAHAILQADNDTFGSKMRLAPSTRPSGVVGLEDKKHDVERLAERRDIAEVERPHGSHRCRIRHLDADSPIAHRLDGSGPLVG